MGNNRFFGPGGVVGLPLILITIVWSSGQILPAQNMVPNPSWESYSSIPTALGQIGLATPWFSVNGSCDFFHTASAGATIPNNFFGNQTPRTGNAYSGIAYSSSNSYHEMIGVPLSSAMVPGQTYYFEIYVSAGEGGYMYGTNNLGVYFSTTPLAGIPAVVPHINYTSVITNYWGWQLISGNYTATAAFTYMTIGNFYSPGATTWVNLGTGGSIASQYWYFEDVLLQSAVILPLDLVHLSAHLENPVTARIDWAAENRESVRHYLIHRSFDNGQTFEEIGMVEAGKEGQLNNYHFLDEPGVSSQMVSYRVKEVHEDGSVHYSELAQVYMPFPGLQNEITSFPNPSSEGQQVTLSFPPVPGQENAQVHLHDLSGRILGSFEIAQQEGINRVTLPVENFEPGIYFVKVSCGLESATSTFTIR